MKEEQNTTVTIKVRTWKILNALRVRPNQTYDEIITNLAERNVRFQEILRTKDAKYEDLKND